MHGTATAVVRQVLFVTATNCVSGYIRVGVLCGRVILNTCQRGTVPTHTATLALNFSIRTVQQWHNSNTSGATYVNLAALIYVLSIL